VRLVDFYAGRHHDDWQFLETADYLRAAGALDESIPGKPSVIIPNYITSTYNCLSPSEYYNVCCKDECEDTMAEIEGKLGRPSAVPGDVVQIVSHVASDTVDAPRNLSTVLVNRLQEIADYHSGQVPLHGRLFAQWMHNAYPRECPFPHVSGTTTPLTQDDYEARGLVAEATEEEMAWQTTQSKWTETETLDDLLPWDMQEELVSLHYQAPQTRPGSSSLRQALFFLGGVASMLSLLRAATGLMPFAAGCAEQKFKRHSI